MRVFDANWIQIEEYLTRDDRIVWDAGVAEVRELLVSGWPE